MEQSGRNRWLQECPLIVMITGGRLPPPSASGLRATRAVSAADGARRRGKPILVLRQQGEIEPEQQEFLDRATGGWEGGR